MSINVPITFQRSYPGVNTQLVDFGTDDGVFLTASLTMPEDKSNQKKLAIINSHGTNSTFLHGVPAFLPPLLAKSGYVSLSFNDRGAGAHYPFSTLEDFRKDMEAALQFMSGHGFNEFLLTGHSLGVVKVSYYQGVTKDPRTKGLALYGPSGSDMPKRAKMEFMGPSAYSKFEQRCKQLIKQHKDEKLMIMPWSEGRELVTTPKNWLSFRGSRSKAKPVRWLREIDLPIMLVYSEKEIVPRSEIDAIRKAAKRLTYFEVPSTKPQEGHFYVGEEQHVADLTAKWLVDNELDQ